MLMLGAQYHHFNSLRRKAGDFWVKYSCSIKFNFNSLRHKAGDNNSIQTTPLLITIFYTKHPIFHLHPIIPLSKRIINHSFISANPSIYLCSLTFRTTLYCFIITPSLQLFQKHFLLFPPQRILFSKIFFIFPVREFSFQSQDSRVCLKIAFGKLCVTLCGRLSE